MKERLKEAMVEGLVVGIRWAIVVMVLGLTGAALLGDYQVVRQKANAGQAAYDFIDKQIKAQQQQAAVPAPSTSATPPTPVTPKGK